MADVTPTWFLPFPELGDEANIEEAVEPLAARLDALLSAIASGELFGFEQFPIGAIVAYAGTTLPAGSKFDWADGGLINKITYATFFTRVGHAYNGGVDPGSNMVRKPDKRGRVPVGADNFGATGDAARIFNSNRLRGQNGGEERHTLLTANMPSHTHIESHTDGGSMQNLSGGPTNRLYQTGMTTPTGATGGGGPHNNLQPYEIDNYLVRIG